MDWELIAELPDEIGQPNKGLAGSFAGISNDVMLIAGGANFQNEMPWEGGKKHWSDKIYVLKRKGNEYKWHSKTFNLPHPIAYGYSISTPNGSGVRAGKAIMEIIGIDCGPSRALLKNFSSSERNKLIEDLRLINFF
tara:strand:- start:292 stop:702 length:411 start_codon:yes stop_codon:yes gene_type:complete